MLFRTLVLFFLSLATLTAGVVPANLYWVFMKTSTEPFPYYRDSILFWDFANANNPTPDTSAIGTNVGYLGSGASAPTWRAASNDCVSCYYFNDAENDYIWKTNGFGDFASMTNGTISYWVRCDSGAANIDRHITICQWVTAPAQTLLIIDCTYNYPYVFRCFLDIDGTRQWEWKTTTLYRPIVNPYTGWKNIVIVHNGVEPRFYVNGYLETNGSWEVSLNKTKWIADLWKGTYKPDNLSLGTTRYYGGNYHPMKGWLSDIVFYKRALSSNEVLNLFVAGMTNYSYSAWDKANYTNSIFRNMKQYINCRYNTGIYVPTLLHYYMNTGSGIGALTGGEAFNGAYWTIKDGKGCYYLDDVNDYLDFYNAPYLTGVSNFTVMSWFYLWRNPNNHYDTLWAYYVDESRRIVLCHGLTDGDGIRNHYIIFADGANYYAHTTNSHLTTGVWHNVTVVFNGAGASNSDKLKYYWNGQQLNLVYDTSMPNKTQSTYGNLRFGVDAPANNRYLPVYLGSIRIWGGNGAQYSLSSNQVYELYQQGR